MNSTSYQIELDTLKETLSQLDQDGLDLGTAMQVYEKGKLHKKGCLDILDALEQSVQSLSIKGLSSQHENTTDDEAPRLDLDLEAIFESLKNIEHTMDSLSDTELEASVNQLVQAEQLIQMGELKVSQLSKEMNASSSSIKGDQCV
jgi:exonuclease VII small subunit